MFPEMVFCIIAIMIEITRAAGEKDLKGILALQQRNLRKHLSPETLSSGGFLTVEHSIEQLKGMNDAEASIIARDHDRVVGYALVMLTSFKDEIPLLGGLFTTVASLSYKGEAIQPEDYVVVGQLCVDADYRGQGLVERLYGHFRDSLKEKFRYLITDISSKNPRSLKAHQKTGFEVLDTFHDQFTGEDWNVVLWDWRRE